MTKKPSSIALAALCALGLVLIAMVVAGPLAAQSPQPDNQEGSPKSKATGSALVKSLGSVAIDSDQNVITPTAIFYTNAHMRAQNGATIDCGDLRGDMDKSGGFTDFVATGNVVAHVPMAQGQTYDISADKAFYDLSAHEIDLTGNPVTATAQTPYTKGPLVQTGDSGVIVLGPSPKYPKITDYPTILMNNVHTQFTPVEQPARNPHANSGKESGQGVQGP